MDELEIPPQTTDSEPDTASSTPQTVSIEDWIAGDSGLAEEPPREALEDTQLLAVLEALVYVSEEPLTVAQTAAALNQEPDRIRALLEQLVAEFDKPEHGVSIREVAGGYKMATKPEHHEAVRSFAKSLKPPLKLSLPALETLAVIAYKQPVTTPEIMEIRGVQGGGVLKTLLDRKLITEAGRKNVIGKPILYKTTKEFLIQFGLKDLSELPSLKEFEEIRRMSMADETPAEPAEPTGLKLEAASATAPAGEGDAAVSEAPAPEQAGPNSAEEPAADAHTAEVAAPVAEEPGAEAERPASEELTVEAATPAAEVPAPAADEPAAEAAVTESTVPEPAPEPPPESQEP